MIKVEVTEDFTLARFDEIKKSLLRKGKEVQGKLFIGDTFECNEEMANYLSGSNKLKRSFVKVIEVLPKMPELPDLEEVKVETSKYIIDTEPKVSTLELRTDKPKTAKKKKTSKK